MLATLPARAAAPVAFSQAAFEAAKKDNKPILIAIAADWCPTCKAQEPILSDLLSDGAFMNMVAFRVDFDAQKDVRARLWSAVAKHADRLCRREGSWPIGCRHGCGFDRGTDARRAVTQPC